MACVLALGLSACSTTERRIHSVQELEAARPGYMAQIQREQTDSVLKLVRRLKREHDDYVAGRSKSPPVCDVLIISGGADYGAFGAGVLQGWGEVKDADTGRPEFDVVSGVSTGALIAPFAVIGDANSYDRAFQLYQQPRNNWVRRRGLFFFLPSNPSLMDISELRTDIRNAFDHSTIKKLAEASQAGRLLKISATNVDYGQRRVWDVGRLAEKAVKQDKPDLDPVHRVLLASSAIPGAFEPVEIGGHLYVDGATTANILYEQEMRSPEAPVAVWRREYPGVKMPKARYWVIINNQLVAPPVVTPPTWVGVVEQSLATSIRASTLTSIQHLSTELALLRATGDVETEFRVIAIPNDWRPPKPGIFVKETMESLAKLGRELGRDPAAWKQDTLLDGPKLPVETSKAPTTAPASR
jgi:predicted acylesterase/phospholipase RssA